MCLSVYGHMVLHIHIHIHIKTDLCLYFFLHLLSRKPPRHVVSFAARNPGAQCIGGLMAKMCYGLPSRHFVLLLHWANTQCQALIVAVLGGPPRVGNPHRDAAILPSWPAMGLDPLRWDLIMEALATHTCGRQAGSGIGEGETPV